jgi:hypothetical protein
MLLRIRSTPAKSPHDPVSTQLADDAAYKRILLRIKLQPHCPYRIEAALTAYEHDLFPRSASEAADAEAILEVCLGPNSPQSLVDLFNSHHPAE